MGEEGLALRRKVGSGMGKRLGGNTPVPTCEVAQREQRSCSKLPQRNTAGGWDPATLSPAPGLGPAPFPPTVCRLPTPRASYDTSVVAASVTDQLPGPNQVLESLT